MLSGLLALAAAAEDKEVEKLGMLIKKLLKAEMEGAQPDYDNSNSNSKVLQVQGKTIPSSHLYWRYFSSDIEEAHQSIGKVEVTYYS